MAIIKSSSTIRTVFCTSGFQTLRFRQGDDDLRLQTTWRVVLFHLPAQAVGCGVSDELTTVSRLCRLTHRWAARFHPFYASSPCGEYCVGCVAGEKTVLHRPFFDLFRPPIMGTIGAGTRMSGPTSAPRHYATE